MAEENWLKVLEKYRREYPPEGHASGGTSSLQSTTGFWLRRPIEGGEFRAGLDLIDSSLKANPGIVSSHSSKLPDHYRPAGGSYLAAPAANWARSHIPDSLAQTDMTSTTTPRCSVVMPVQNAAQFVGAAVESVLRQTMPDFELLVVNDRSSDGSETIVRNIGDSRIILLPSNGEGVAAARNTALRTTRANYVAFLDADDLWLPEHLQLHLDHLENRPELDLAFSSVKWIEESGEPLGRPVSSHPGRFSYEDLLLEYLPVTTSGWAGRRAAFEQAGWFERGSGRGKRS
ncbi:MAG: glycosyltransferase family 2 protein [Paludibaculum sp.]